MRCRTKPREVEAIRYTGDNYDEILALTQNHVNKEKYDDDLILVTDGWNIVVHVGDWIVKLDEYQFEVFGNDEFNESFETL